MQSQYRYLDNRTLNVYLAFGSSSKELKEFQNTVLDTQRLRLKSSKIDPQMLLKN